MTERATDTIPQLVIELDAGLAKAMDDSFGDKAFEEWVRRVRGGGFMVSAWSGDEDAPPVFLALSEELRERLMTDEDRQAMDALEFDEDGVTRGGAYAVRVTAVETGFEDVAIRLDACLTAVPGTGGART